MQYAVFLKWFNMPSVKYIFFFFHLSEKGKLFNRILNLLTFFVIFILYTLIRIGFIKYQGFLCGFSHSNSAIINLPKQYQIR